MQVKEIIKKLLVSAIELKASDIFFFFLKKKA